ncbi:amino acid oxidase [Photobacterium leiognathi subsp. mandapamensis]|uniref:FAD-dependent oxidoreductase n=1 Tax=Photobacterium leiognathi TaxID=553611 RepID=UPI000D15D586|nr:FAD-dependent oxidoreductase [Photobacterium leiognathi]PSW65244.1 amino acid oxidase [Photobacterium leiognathi subsp. mandapamensis]
MNKDIVIIGGGFFGLFIAEFLAKSGKSVLLVEKESDLMQRASYVNQARVHNGYHYPRSVLTALRSRISFPRFVDEFKDCVVSDFDKYYLTANVLGKVTGQQFKKFCDRIGASCDPAPESIRKLVNPNLIDKVFTTKEYAFDSTILKNTMFARVQNTGVEVLTDHLVTNVKQSLSGGLETTIISKGTEFKVISQQVFNCTYAMLNNVINNSGLEFIPLKHEMTEMCIVDVPEQFKNTGLTVMCGPFFSVMPFPSKGAHSFSHVRYTPHHEWYDNDNKPYLNAHEHYSCVSKETAWNKMIKDAQRYIPSLSDCIYKESIWEVKTVLPRSESDDSRPILFKPNYGLKGFHCIMGGKIDNVYDAVDVIIDLGLDR